MHRYEAKPPLSGRSVPSRLVPRRPVIASDWWRICEMPDLGPLQGADPAHQHIVDHGFIRAADGSWQLWACLRGTAVSRLIYGWEGESPDRGPWKPAGVKLRARAEYGESVDSDGAEAIGAPFFAKFGDTYYCFFHSNGIHAMTSKDGLNYERQLDGQGRSLLYPHGGRDVMLLRIGDRYFSYSCITTSGREGLAHSAVILRTSPDLREWGDYFVVSEGGICGSGGVSAESPFVVAMDGYFYLFRASSMDFNTYVYRSTNPYDFGVGNDNKLIAILPIKAPELFEHEGQWHISDLADFQGIKLARLSWEEASPETGPRVAGFPFDA